MPLHQIGPSDYPCNNSKLNTRWPMTLNFTIEPINVLTIELLQRFEDNFFKVKSLRASEMISWHKLPRVQFILKLSMNLVPGWYYRKSLSTRLVLPQDMPSFLWYQCIDGDYVPEEGLNSTSTLLEGQVLESKHCTIVVVNCAEASV